MVSNKTKSQAIIFNDYGYSQEILLDLLFFNAKTQNDRRENAYFVKAGEDFKMV